MERALKHLCEQAVDKLTVSLAEKQEMGSESLERKQTGELTTGLTQMSSRAPDKDCLPLAKATPARMPSSQAYEIAQKRLRLPGIEVGVNAVSRLVGQNKVAVVLAMPDQDALLLSPVVRLCRTANIPCFAAKALVERLAVYTHIRRITLFAILRNCSKDCDQGGDSPARSTTEGKSTTLVLKHKIVESGPPISPNSSPSDAASLDNLSVAAESVLQPLLDLLLPLAPRARPLQDYIPERVKRFKLGVKSSRK